MWAKIRIALAAVLLLGTASAALAGGSRNDGPSGGYVVPGSLDGVNPAVHPRIFGNPAVAHSYGFLQSRDGSWHVRPDWRWGGYDYR
jgi:hypothetical protein